MAQKFIPGEGKLAGWWYMLDLIGQDENVKVLAATPQVTLQKSELLDFHHEGVKCGTERKADNQYPTELLHNVDDQNVNETLTHAEQSMPSDNLMVNKSTKVTKLPVTITKHLSVKQQKQSRKPLWLKKKRNGRKNSINIHSKVDGQGSTELSQNPVKDSLELGRVEQQSASESFARNPKQLGKPWLLKKRKNGRKNSGNTDNKAGGQDITELSQNPVKDSLELCRLEQQSASESYTKKPMKLRKFGWLMRGEYGRKKSGTTDKKAGGQDITELSQNPDKDSLEPGRVGASEAFARKLRKPGWLKRGKNGRKNSVSTDNKAAGHGITELSQNPDKNCLEPGRVGASESFARKLRKPGWLKRGKNGRKNSGTTDNKAGGQDITELSQNPDKDSLEPGRVGASESFARKLRKPGWLKRGKNGRKNSGTTDNKAGGQDITELSHNPVKDGLELCRLEQQSVSESYTKKPMILRKSRWLKRGGNGRKSSVSTDNKAAGHGITELSQNPDRNSLQPSRVGASESFARKVRKPGWLKRGENGRKNSGTTDNKAGGQDITELSQNPVKDGLKLCRLEQQSASESYTKKPMKLRKFGWLKRGKNSRKNSVTTDNKAAGHGITELSQNSDKNSLEPGRVGASESFARKLRKPRWLKRGENGRKNNGTTDNKADGHGITELSQNPDKNSLEPGRVGASEYFARKPKKLRKPGWLKRGKNGRNNSGTTDNKAGGQDITELSQNPVKDGFELCRLEQQASESYTKKPMKLRKSGWLKREENGRKNNGRTDNKAAGHGITELSQNPDKDSLEPGRVGASESFARKLRKPRWLKRGENGRKNNGSTDNKADGHGNTELSQNPDKNCLEPGRVGASESFARKPKKLRKSGWLKRGENGRNNSGTTDNKADGKGITELSQNPDKNTLELSRVEQQSVSVKPKKLRKPWWSKKRKNGRKNNGNTGNKAGGQGITESSQNPVKESLELCRIEQQGASESFAKKPKQLRKPGCLKKINNSRKNNGNGDNQAGGQSVTELSQNLVNANGDLSEYVGKEITKHSKVVRNVFSKENEADLPYHSVPNPELIMNVSTRNPAQTSSESNPTLNENPESLNNMEIDNTPIEILNKSSNNPFVSVIHNTGSNEMQGQTFASENCDCGANAMNSDKISSPLAQNTCNIMLFCENANELDDIDMPLNLEDSSLKLSMHCAGSTSYNIGSGTHYTNLFQPEKANQKSIAWDEDDFEDIISIELLDPNLYVPSIQNDNNTPSTVFCEAPHKISWSCDDNDDTVDSYEVFDPNRDTLETTDVHNGTDTPPMMFFEVPKNSQKKLRTRIWKKMRAFLIKRKYRIKS